jgi:hypothetical protein
VSTIVFSPDSRRVVTASWDRTARVWDARTGQPLMRELRHDDHVLDARFSPDGRQITTASRDRTARVWDAATGLPLSEPLGHEQPVRAVSFCANDRLLTVCEDGSARVWEVPFFRGAPPPWLAELAHALAGGAPSLSEVRRDALREPGTGAYGVLAQRLFSTAEPVR